MKCIGGINFYGIRNINECNGYLVIMGEFIMEEIEFDWRMKRCQQDIKDHEEWVKTYKKQLKQWITEKREKLNDNSSAFLKGVSHGMKLARQQIIEDLNPLVIKQQSVEDKESEVK